jgi:hypothetical protein
MDTGARLLRLQFDTRNSADNRSKIAETGHDGANHVRQQCRELMDGALVLGQEEQRAELWRCTT